MAQDWREYISGKFPPMTTTPKAARPTAPVGSRCSMCLCPGPHHDGLRQCVEEMQKRLSVLTSDPGMIPPPPQPPLTFAQMRDAAYANWMARSPAQRHGLVWVEPTAEEIRRVARH